MRTSDENKIIVNIIRHGRTALNEKRCYLGITDESLSLNGENEIKNKVNSNIYPKVEILFVSPMKRVRETAKIIYPGMEQIEIPDFIEMDFGDFEGKCYEELKDNNYYRDWIDGTVDESESGILLPEERKHFIKRTVTGFYDVINKSHGKREISIVAHGGTIMALTHYFTGCDYYSNMLSCGDGIIAEIEYVKDEYGSIKISCFSIIGRICS